MSNGQKFCENALWRTEKRREFAFEWADNTLVRYIDNPPLSMLEEAVAYLNGSWGCTKLTLEGKVVLGEWQTIGAWMEEGKPDRAGLRIMRLYHACGPVAATGSAALYTESNNCTYNVTHTPYFRQATLPTPPTGTSGITYEITGQRQDTETGFWMCTLVKREQLTTTTGVVVISDNTRETVYQQGWYGVRAGNKDHTGAAVALWAVNTSVAGTRVRDVFVDKNENCTINIVQQKTIQKTGTIEERSSRDTFSATDTVIDVAAEVLGAAPVPADGVTTDHRDELDESGLYRRVKTREVEQDVDNAVVDMAEDAAETVTEVEHRGKAAQMDTPTDPDGTLSRVTNSRSKAGRWTQRLRQSVAKLWENHTIRRVRDIFGYEEEIQTDGVATDDLPDAPAAAQGGVWGEQLLKQRKDRKWNVNQIAHTEEDLEVAESVVEASALESVSETESINNEALDISAPATGSVVRVVHSRTRGGKWRRRLREQLENIVARTYTARETIEESVSSEVGQAAELTLDNAGSGSYSTGSASLTVGGLLRYVKQVIVEKLWSRSFTVADDYFSRATQERGVAAELDFSSTVGNAISASGDVTPGGLIRYSKSTDTAKTGQSWTLLNQETSSYDGYTCEKIMVKLYANVELAQAQADVAAFVAGLNGFTIVRDSWRAEYYFEHDISFGLHVNKYGRWDGTVTARAHAVPGSAYTHTEVSE